MKSLFPAVIDSPKEFTYEDFNLIHVAIVQSNPIIAGADYNYADISKKADYIEIHVELQSPYHIDNQDVFLKWYQRWEMTILDGYPEMM